jgi:hypothetical protein
MALPDESIQEAYRGAHYRVNGYTLRIDAPHPDFDAYLTRHQIESYVILTAHNPRSHRLSPAINRVRHVTLLRLLDRRSDRYTPATGEDPSGNWPREEGVCLLDPAPGLGREIARIYEQHAIVEGNRGHRPQLYWL